MFDLNEMYVFAKVVEAGGFSAAARALDLPKSTVSRRVAKLERTLGARLLHRTTRQLRLTELGEAFYQRCLRMVAEAEEAERLVDRDHEHPRGLLRVTAPVDGAGQRIGAIAAEYLRRYPDVELELILANRMVDLVEEGVDLALRAGAMPDSTLVARRLGGGRMVFCASPAYLAEFGEPTTLEEFRQHSHVIYDVNGRRSTQVELNRNGQVERIGLSGRLGVTTLEAARDAAVAGFGIARLPQTVCRQHLEDGVLRAVLPDWLSTPAQIYAVYPSARHLSAKVRCFIELMQERADLIF